MVTATDAGTPGQETASASSSWTLVENTPPVISEGASTSTSMDEDGSPTPFDLTLHASDIDLDVISWSILSQPVSGTASVTGNDLLASVYYTPTTNYNGSHSFTVQTSDGKGGTDTITVNVTVNPRNDPPAQPSGSFLHRLDAYW